MTPSELKYQVEQSGKVPHFFTRKTMQFFGDTMKNYGVKKTNVECYDGTIKEVWELYRKRPVKYGLHASAYFDVKTFESIFPKKGE